MVRLFALLARSFGVTACRRGLVALAMGSAAACTPSAEWEEVEFDAVSSTVSDVAPEVGVPAAEPSVEASRAKVRVAKPPPPAPRVSAADSTALVERLVGHWSDGESRHDYWRVLDAAAGRLEATFVDRADADNSWSATVQIVEAKTPQVLVVRFDRSDSGQRPMNWEVHVSREQFRVGRVWTGSGGGWDEYVYLHNRQRASDATAP